MKQKISTLQSSILNSPRKIMISKKFKILNHTCAPQNLPHPEKFHYLTISKNLSASTHKINVDAEAWYHPPKNEKLE